MLPKTGPRNLLFEFYSNEKIETDSAGARTQTSLPVSSASASPKRRDTLVAFCAGVSAKVNRNSRACGEVWKIAITRSSSVSRMKTQDASSEKRCHTAHPL